MTALQWLKVTVIGAMRQRRMLIDTAIRLLKDADIGTFVSMYDQEAFFVQKVARDLYIVRCQMHSPLGMFDTHGNAVVLSRKRIGQ